MEMPSQEEQTVAENYVLDRLLVRPDTDFKKAIRCSLIYVSSCIAVALLMLFLFRWLGIFSLLPDGFNTFRTTHPIWFHLLFFIAVFLCIGAFCLKAAAIGCIRLYQHYAPEEIRRRCLFKPTCSEYTILAIQKYGLIIGLIKAYIRLFWKCRGNIYRIDFP